MALLLEDKDRKVIPQWRDFTTAAALGELDSLQSISQTPVSQGDFFREKLEDWKTNKTVAFATDLVGAAYVLHRGDEAAEAISFVLSPDSGAPAIARVLDQKIGARQDKWASQVPPVLDEDVNPRQEVHKLKARVHDDPRNSILWVELARCYAILGVVEKARRAMSVALSMAPRNRFVLRAASRLHVHLDDYDYAHELLLRAEPTLSDPWLLSAEIALASVAGRTSRLIKAGKQMLSSGDFDSLHTSELASALATLELGAGDIRKSRKLFRQALLKPNDNSVAQAVWASRQIRDFDIDPNYLETPYSFEARAWTNYVQADWIKALSESWKWFYDQPFSTRPAVHGSYIASVILEDHEQSAQIAREGLVANPHDFTLLNNLTFALANSGRVSEAEEQFGKIKIPELKPREHIVFLATRGLLCYRRGQLEEGRTLYLEAIKRASGASFATLRSRAALHWAFEELRSNTQAALDAVKLARELFQVDARPETNILLERLNNSARSRQL